MVRNKIQTNKGRANKQAGEMSFLIMILMFLVALFVIWVLTGGPNSKTSQYPFIRPGNDQSAPLQVYGE